MRTRGGRRRPFLLAIVALIATIAWPASAGAKIEIHDAAGEQLLGTIKKGKCKLEGRRPNRVFFANAKSTNGAYRLQVGITKDWRGFGADYPLLYGGLGTSFNLLDGRNTFSNYPIPGTPPATVGGGAIRFSAHHRKLAIGFAPAPNVDFTEGVVFGGAMKCKYPR